MSKKRMYTLIHGVWLFLILGKKVSEKTSLQVRYGPVKCTEHGRDEKTQVHWPPLFRSRVVFLSFPHHCLVSVLLQVHPWQICTCARCFKFSNTMISNICTWWMHIGRKIDFNVYWTKTFTWIFKNKCIGLKWWLE